MGIVDKLHDRIDAREEMARKARETAKNIVIKRMQEALDQTNTIKDALTLMSVWLAQELDSQTTDAVKGGAKIMEGLFENK